jgi:hypothetical protein
MPAIPPTQSKSVYADFYHIEQQGVNQTTVARDLLASHLNGHAPAHSLDDLNIKFQIRSISHASNDGRIFKAVFGKLRHGETPEQASESTDDADVELKAGHGLVEKNHFLFFSDLNLIVFQRNGHAGRNSHLQAYLNKPTYAHVSLSPILTQDSYSKLLNGDALKKIEISLRKPAATLQQEDTFLKDFIDSFQGQSIGSLKITLSAERQGTLRESLKDALVTLSKFGRTRIARATLVDDNVIDLMLDRVTHKFSVPVQANGRPTPSDLFSGLANAKDQRSDDLESYFNP